MKNPRILLGACGVGISLFLFHMNSGSQGPSASSMAASATGAATTARNSGSTQLTQGMAEYLADLPAAQVTKVLNGKSRRSIKMRNLARSPQAEKFVQERLLRKGFEQKYEGLPMGKTLSRQIAFQLYRDDVISNKVKNPRYFVEPKGSDEPDALVASVSKKRGTRRHSYSTPYFEDLKAQGTWALADIRVVLERLPETEQKEREELLRLTYALGKDPEINSQAKKILMDEAMSNRSGALPFAAMNHFNRLERDAARRKEANQKFIEAHDPEVIAKSMSKGRMLAQARKARAASKASAGKGIGVGK